MPSLRGALTAALAFVASGVLASPIVATPGGVNDIVITKDNTVNATTHYKLPIQIAAATTSTAGQLNLSFVNNLASNNVNAYVTGLDSSGQLVMLYPNGTWYHPTADNTGIPKAITADVAIPLGPQGSAVQISLPGYLSAGRIWFSDGDLQFFTVMGGNGPALVEPSAVNPSDPSAGVNWGFVELTWTANGGIYANISYVDFVGLPLGMYLTTSDNNNQSALGVTRDAVAEICANLAAQSKIDGQPWDSLCVTDSSGTPLRILSPTQYLSTNSSAWSTYWNNYIDQVWTHYTTNNLTINTQVAAGLVNCSVTGETLYCAGDNRGYAKPTAEDLYGCNGGPFAIESGDNSVHYAVVPRLCAAFHRAELLLPGGNIQPSLNSSYYYTQSPTNHYSRVVHKYEIDGKGYAFAYDDVTPDGAVNDSGLLSDPNPVLLAITAGGPLSSTAKISTISSTQTSTKSSTTTSSTKQSISTTSSRSSSSSTISKSSSSTTSSSKTTSTSSTTKLSTTSLYSNISKPAVGTIIASSSSMTLSSSSVSSKSQSSSSMTQTPTKISSSSTTSTSSVQTQASSNSVALSTVVVSPIQSQASSTSVKSSTTSIQTSSPQSQTSSTSSKSSSASVSSTVKSSSTTSSSKKTTTTTAKAANAKVTSTQKSSSSNVVKVVTATVTHTTFEETTMTTLTTLTLSSHKTTTTKKPAKKTTTKTTTKTATGKTTVVVKAVEHTSTTTSDLVATHHTTTTQQSSKTTNKAGAKKTSTHKMSTTKKHKTKTTRASSASTQAASTLKKVVKPATTVQQDAAAATASEQAHKPFSDKAIELLTLFANGTWTWGS